MKKFLIALSAVAVFTGVNKAQAQKGFSVSVKGTPQFSWIQNSDDNDNSAVDIKPTFGVNFGVGAGYNFTKDMGVALDVIYSMQGRQYEAGPLEFKQKVDYLKVPLMFTYNTNSEKTVSFVGKIGPQLGILMSSSLQDGDGDKLVDDMNDQYETISFGGVANLGAQFRLDKKLFLTAGARFDFDFTNAENEDYTFYTPGRAQSNNITLGLEIGLKMQL